ncbi:MAG: sulfatase-like hydrolase/transferase [Acidobacteria bacterium]|nr:sulfatase-like hydrolase/transferase [Acidobacteriota bacterium]
MNHSSNPRHGVSRRSLLQSASAALAPLAAGAPDAAAQSAAARPNIVMIISDQFRWDCVGAMGLNPMNLTPNIDAMANRGVLFRNAISSQSVCAPARGSIFTGQYSSRHGVWRNGIGLKPDATTLASSLRQAGYSANYIGKWHLAGNAGNPAERGANGPVRPENRGGFLDLWQASNVLEFTSQPYEGDLYDNDGKPLHFSGVYRSDFMTSLAQRFLRSAKSPFFLTLSYLEVHHQNDKDAFIPPKEYAGRYKNPFIPQDLRPLPGSWPSQLSDYFACVAKMDETVGTIRETLAETGLDRNTIVMFVSDHACHFKTRNSEYKRSPHESSIHIPLVIEGPGFNRSIQIPELVSQVDLAPSLLAAAGLPIPGTMQGHSFLPLLDRKTEGWRNEAYFEMNEFMTFRGVRTPQYTLAAAVPKTQAWKPIPGSDRYVEHMLYDLHADPYQHVNLAGNVQYQAVSDHLRQRLAERIFEAGGTRAAIEPAYFPYP